MHDKQSPTQRIKTCSRPWVQHESFKVAILKLQSTHSNYSFEVSVCGTLIKFTITCSLPLHVSEVTGAKQANCGERNKSFYSLTLAATLEGTF